MVDSLFIEAARTTDQLKNKTSRSMNGHSARNKMGAHIPYISISDLLSFRDKNGGVLGAWLRFTA
jgi:hypothetical protein